MIISLKGHHGTSSKSASEIIYKNYNLSIGNNEWLGDGVYFFIKGINSKTVELAEKWAIAQSWDKEKKIQKYIRYCIIESDIQVNESNFLDLTTEEGVEVLSYIAKTYSEKLKTIGKRLSYAEGFLLNLARKENLLPLEVVKGSFYIKFKEERIINLNLRTNNCTICCVYNPSKTISSNNIIKTANIK